MKILLDHNLDRRLKEHLSGHEVATAYELGWSNLLNGKLLSAAEDMGFHILLTADSNISKQQSLSDRSVSVVVLRAYNNRLATHLEMIDDIRFGLVGIGSGVFKEIFHPKFQKK